MNQREAKRVACAMAATLLENDLAASTASLRKWVNTEEDRERLQAAFYELIDELERRGDLSGLPEVDDD